jgi:hypothetical protein
VLSIAVRKNSLYSKPNMRYQKKITPTEYKKWMLLQTTVGTVEGLIEKDLFSLTSFLRGLDELQKTVFKEITGIEITDSFLLSVTDGTSLRLLLLKTFISQIGLDIIKEARPGIGATEEEIYLSLLADLKEDKFPEDIFAYSIYRRRGSPVSWMDIGKITADEAKERLYSHKNSIINSLVFRMKMNREFVLLTDVNDLSLLVLKKPRKPQVITGAKKNYEVSGGSYTLIVLNRSKNRIGVVSGSLKEIGAIYSNLRNKVYKDLLAPTRNEIEISGVTVFDKLVKPNSTDGLTLQGLELGKTGLADNPSIKLKVQGNKSIDAALESIDNIIDDSTSITDLKSADYLVNGKKNVAIYTGSDDWHRVYINISTKRITEQLESDFIDQINNRLGEDIDIKKARLVVSNLDICDIVEKFLKEKSVSLYPPIPKKAEEVLVKLKNLKLVKDAGTSTKRICYNCWNKSWDKWLCPNCDRSDMRIVGESLGLSIDEMTMLRRISKAKIGDQFEVTYHRKRQRNNYSKPIIELHNNQKNITTFVVIVDKRRDLKFASDLSREGVGVVALVDPKMSNKIDTIENHGASVVKLERSVTALIEDGDQDDLKEMILDQEQQILSRVFDNAQASVNRLKDKPDVFNERDFEVDIKNIIQMIVPDVVWLGAKYSGTSVPDGYCRYKARPRKLFGWDAKYSETGKYRLVAKDVEKQKKYIQWLTDPKKDPAKLAPLGAYGFISNFDEPKNIKDAVSKVANFSKLPKDARVVIVDDKLFALVGEWLIDHWQQVIDNNSKVAEELFKWFRRKQRGNKYTISRASDWRWLEPRLNKLID